mmetsp:Transcript_36968/g.82180  ORF Transcript_36968/g.82180 Transcript_36968/m.82180 type:complete len:968 (+) Transcript_36968:95-2998(+)
MKGTHVFASQPKCSGAPLQASRPLPVSTLRRHLRGSIVANTAMADPVTKQDSSIPEVYTKFNLPYVFPEDARVEKMPNGTYRLKDEHHKGINPFEKLKLAKEPHQMMIVDKEYEKMAKIPFKEYDAQGKTAEDDLDHRLKWVGFFHRRKITYGRYMMRTKIPNGILSAKQLRTLADIVAKYPEDGCADITTRQNWQLRGMPLEDIPSIIESMRAVGLTSVQSGLDNVRNTVGNPLAGIDPEEIINTRPLCELIDRYVTNDGKGNPEITNLPRKWNVCVVGTHDLYEHPHINDLAFMPATKDGVMGFNILVGGFFSATRCAEAIPMDAWVPSEHIVHATHAILTTFRDYGARANRQKCRMMWLIEEMGMDKWKAEVARRMPGGVMQGAGQDLCDPTRTRRSYYGVHKQKQAGLNYVGVHVPVGRVEAEDMYAMADLAEKYGDGEIRLTVEENFILSGVPDAKVDALLKEPLLQKFSPFPGRVMAGTVSCTGNQFCGFSNIDTKRSAWMVGEHLESLFDFPRDLRVHWTGCPNTCGQIQVGDIGLMGTQVKNPNGPGKVPAVDIYVGGRIGADSHLAEVWKEGVRLDDQLLPTLEELVVERFGAKRRAAALPNPANWKTLKSKSHENKKVDAAAAAAAAGYVCSDCGYLHVASAAEFTALPEDFACPQCGAAKNRFKASEPAAAAAAPKRAPKRVAPSGAPVALDPSKPVALTLIEKETISHDTRRFRFALPTPQHVLGLPIGQHVMLSYTDAATGEVVSRPYTPTTSDADVGFVDFVIKVYFSNTNPKFPAGGRMSQHLESLKVGDTLNFQGPTGRITYTGAGVFSVKDYVAGTESSRQAAKSIGMVAGGTGITPMMQVARHILAQKEDIEIRMLVANQTEADILMRPELDKMVVSHPNVKVYYTLDRPPSGWRQGSGFITEEMLKAHLPAPGPETQVLLCGPPPMVNMACLPNLEKLGFKQDNILVF